MSTLTSIALLSILAQADAGAVGSPADEQGTRGPMSLRERDELVRRVRDTGLSLESKSRLLSDQLSRPWKSAQSDFEHAQDFASIAGAARPADHQYALCLEVARALGAMAPSRSVRITAVNSWGDAEPAVLLEGDALRATLPVTLDVPDCLPWVVVRFVPDGPTVTADLKKGRAVARATGNDSLALVSSLTQVSWEYPGWRDDNRVHLSAGARFIVWRRWLHADVGLKLSTFSVPWIAALPGGLALDAFIGFPFAFAFDHWQLRIALDVGVWSTFCPTVRGAAAVILGRRFVLSAEYATHLYPMAAVQPIRTASAARGRSVRELPLLERGPRRGLDSVAVIRVSLLSASSAR